MQIGTTEFTNPTRWAFGAVGGFGRSPGLAPICRGGLPNRDGIHELRVKDQVTSGSPLSGRRTFAQGFAVQILNPKVAIFFVAYFPQFIDPNDAMLPQIAVLGLIYLAIACASDSAYVLCSSFAARRLATSVRTRFRLARIRAVSYVGLGLLAIFSGPRASATARTT
jgi:threonine/homoserine/homoserine lactone efflux protein